MSKLRKKLTRHFTQVPNELVKDKRLSWRAKGIYVHLISKPDDWDYYVSEVIDSSTDGKDSVQTGFKELEKLGYLERVRVKNDRGQFKGWDYFIYDVPTEQRLSRQMDIPIVGNTDDREDGQSRNPSVEKSAATNTNLTNTDPTKTYLHNTLLSNESFFEQILKIKSTMELVHYLREHYEGYMISFTDASIKLPAADGNNFEMTIRPIIKNGLLFNPFSNRDFRPDDAKTIWAFIFKHRTELILKQKEIA